MSNSQPEPSEQRLGTVSTYARERGVTEATVRRWISKGMFPVYRARGQRGVLIDHDEANAALAEQRDKIRPGWGTFGPDADVRELPRQQPSQPSQPSQARVKVGYANQYRRAQGGGR